MIQENAIVRGNSDHYGKNDKPRVLLIGDSVVSNFYEKLRDKLSDVCYIDCAGFSYSFDNKLFTAISECYIKYNNYSLVLFASGVNGLHIQPRLYRPRLEKLLSKANEHSKIAIATIPLVLNPNTTRPHSQWGKRLEERNAYIVNLAQSEGYTVCDLYKTSLAIPYELRMPDGIHYLPTGEGPLSETVAQTIISLL